jgi:hypothetical protein
MAEERILQIVLAATAVAGLLAAWAGGIAAAAALALCVGLAASSGKLAFDSVVQRDAPDANRGRSFARFETRFQLTWVVGAFLPVVITIPMAVGFLVIAAAAAFAVISYLAGLRGLARGQLPVRRRPTELITSRLRRRRLGFAVDQTDGDPPPADDDLVDEADRYEPEAPTAVEPAPDPNAPRLFDEPAEGDAPSAGAASPAPSEDEPPSTHTTRNDHRVVIDPTNL